jgi:hypothetical protein
MTTESVTQSDTEQNRMNETDIAHLAGVVDVAGNIRLKVMKRSSYKINHSIEAHIIVSRPNKEDPLFGKLMEYCDNRMIKYSFSEVQSYTSSETKSGKLEIKGIEEVEKFLTPLMDYLVTNRFRAELMLEVVVPAIRNDEHLEKEGFYELVGLSEKLREGQVQSNEPKYTQEYFEEKWSLAK